MKNSIIQLIFLAIIHTGFNAQVTVTFQPDATQGKDALIWYLSDQNGSFGPTNTTNYGDTKAFIAMEWTWSGSEGTRKSLIDFDISSLPANIQISNASLSLYAYPNSPDGGHNPLSGSNSCSLSEIVTPWTENTVTWNTAPSTSASGQAILAQSNNQNQDYLNIDVTSIIQNKHNNPSSSHGFMLELITTNYYRSLVFASSDHLDPNKRPKLDITYTSTNSILETEDNIDFDVFPNPSNGSFTIQAEKEYTFKVFDLYGNVIYEHANKTLSNSTFDLSKFAKGNYFVEVQSGDQKQTKRVVLL